MPIGSALPWPAKEFGSNRKRTLESRGLRLLGRPRPPPVHVDSQRDRGVSELPLHPRDLRPVLQRQSRERVPQRMERPSTSSLALAGNTRPAQRLVEDALGEVRRVEVVAGLLLKDQPTRRLGRAGQLEPV